MSNVDPVDFVLIADILNAMDDNGIKWPNHLYVTSNRVDFRYKLGGDDD